MKVISSRDNQYIKLARKLDIRKNREREGLFFIEGKRSVSEALKKPELLHCVFLQEGIEAEYEKHIALEKADSFLLDSSLMDYICSTDTPQGIAAIVKKPCWSIEDIAGKGSLLLYLDHLSDPGNMGSIIRTCWAFGIEGILMSKGCVDPFSPKVVRSSMGGILNVALFQNIDIEDLDVVKKMNYRFMCSDLNAEENIYSMDFKERELLIIGNEANGVSRELKKYCDSFLKIPMNSGVDSLNVAAACAIIIAEVRRQHFYR